MKIPTIHLNGTAAQDLLDDLFNAMAATKAAVEVLNKTAPNGRDYYPQGHGVIWIAEEEHRARVQKLLDVCNELQQITEGIDAQGRK